MRRDVFKAIADPNRRTIINMLSHKMLNLNSIAKRFDISRPAVSKHIKILIECELVTIRKKGREHFCEAHLEKLNEVSDWLAKYKRFWNGKQNALEHYPQELQNKDKNQQ